MPITRDTSSPPLRCATTALLGFLMFTGPALAATQSEVTSIIAEESARNGRVPLALALAVAKVESDFHDDATSSVGARGVMQIMPATAMSEFGVPAEALADPRLNVKLGIRYLERLHNRYGENWELALSHYNGGGLSVESGQFVPHTYTRQYVADVMRWARTYETDGTLMALANPGANPSAGPTITPAAQPALQLASAEATPPATETVTPLAPAADAAATPEAPAAPAAAETARPVSYPPANELHERFRASLAQRGYATPALEASRETAGPASAVASGVARAGRFSYAPYGS